MPGGITEEATAAARAWIGSLSSCCHADQQGMNDHEDRIVAYYLGIDEDAPIWPNAGEVAARVGTARSAVADALEAARDRWHKSADLNAVRAEIDALLIRLAALRQSMSLLHNCSPPGDQLKTTSDSGRCARGPRSALRSNWKPPCRPSVLPHTSILRGARPSSPYQPRQRSMPAGSHELRELLAKEDPLPNPGRVEEELGLVPVPEGASQLAADRRLRLAVAASKGAALSVRGELYPRGMPALVALRLSLGALAGADVLREDEIRARVLGRFPESSLLPPRPHLDAILQEANAGRIWREPPGGEAGYYARTISDTGTGTVAIVRSPTQSPAPEATPEVLDARAIEDKIVYAADRGIFLAITVEPRRARDVRGRAPSSLPPRGG